jgi:hypothetical protein
MLGRISSYLSVKESEVSMFVWGAICGAVGRAIAPKVGKYFLLIEKMFQDPECRRLCIGAASMGLIRKRTASFSHRMRKYFHPKLWEYFNALGADEWEEFNDALEERLDELLENDDMFDDDDSTSKRLKEIRRQTAELQERLREKQDELRTNGLFGKKPPGSPFTF